MATAASEILRAQIQGAQLDQVFATQAREFIQQLFQRFAFALACLCETIEGVEGARLAKLQNHFCARHPVGAFAVNQMADDVERGPSAFTFVSGCPWLREVAQERVEGGWRASEKLYGVIQVVFHRAPPICGLRFSRESVCAIILQDKCRL